MKYLLFIIMVTLTQGTWAKEKCWGKINFEGTINAGTYDYWQRSLIIFKEKSCQAVLVNLNTPGGSLETTRMIVEEIMNSSIPILCLVSPQGARAGSAGAIILQACHLNGALKATNLGAATPILGNGEDIKGDLKNKIVEDTKAWVLGLAKERGRDQNFAVESISDAKSLDAEAAFKANAIDFFGNDEDEFIKFAIGKKININQNTSTELTEGEINPINTDFRAKFLQLLSDPEVAYLVFMGSLALLYFEITHAGVIAPGILGGIGLVLSLMAFHKLQIAWGGVALISLGLLFFILEIFITSFGALAVGGIISFLLGSMFLFEKGAIPYAIPWRSVIPVTIFLAGIISLLTSMTIKTLRLRKRTVQGVGVGNVAHVININQSDLHLGQCKVGGEIWACRSQRGSLHLDKTYRVIEQQGLTLILKLEE